MASDEGVLRGGLSWEQLADGRLWRLKRGKHYTIESRRLQETASDAANRLGKAVKTMRDEMGTSQYLWLQFADHEVALGDPCPCGGTELVRLHQDFARCTTCGATLLLGASRDDELLDPYEGMPPMRRLSAQIKRARLTPQPLEAYTDVQLSLYERTPELERYRGYATHPAGERVLLLVDYPLQNGARVPFPDDPSRVVQSVLQWPAEPFDGALDFEALADETDESARD